MAGRLPKRAFRASVAALALSAAFPAAAGQSKELVGSYQLVKRVTKEGTELKSPDVVGFMTYTKTRRTVIMKWNASDGGAVSISFIAGYSIGGGKYCENIVYGVQSNLGGPGVSYDAPSDSPTCTAAITDATGLSFDVPNEKLRLRVTRDGIIATTPRWTDHWERAK